MNNKQSLITEEELNSLLEMNPTYDGSEAKRKETPHSDGAPDWKDINKLKKEKEQSSLKSSSKEKKDDGLKTREIIPLAKDQGFIKAAAHSSNLVTNSEYNSLVDQEEFLPKKEEDSDPQTLKDLIQKEGMITPDAGSHLLNRSPWFGMAVNPPGGYNDKNFCPGGISPEEVPVMGSDQDPANTLVAQKKFVPNEESISIQERSLIKLPLAEEKSMRFIRELDLKKNVTNVHERIAQTLLENRKIKLNRSK